MEVVVGEEGYRLRSPCPQRASDSWEAVNCENAM